MRCVVGHAAGELEPEAVAWVSVPAPAPAPLLPATMPVIPNRDSSTVAAFVREGVSLPLPKPLVFLVFLVPPCPAPHAGLGVLSPEDADAEYGLLLCCFVGEEPWACVVDVISFMSAVNTVSARAVRSLGIMEMLARMDACFVAGAGEQESRSGSTYTNARLLHQPASNLNIVLIQRLSIN